MVGQPEHGAQVVERRVQASRLQCTEERSDFHRVR
jgi:hypothetical protein